MTQRLTIPRQYAKKIFFERALRRGFLPPSGLTLGPPVDYERPFGNGRSFLGLPIVMFSDYRLSVQ